MGCNISYMMNIDVWNKFIICEKNYINNNVNYILII